MIEKPQHNSDIGSNLPGIESDLYIRQVDVRASDDGTRVFEACLQQNLRVTRVLENGRYALFREVLNEGTARVLLHDDDVDVELSKFLQYSIPDLTEANDDHVIFHLLAPSWKQHRQPGTQDEIHGGSHDDGQYQDPCVGDDGDYDLGAPLAIREIEERIVTGEQQHNDEQGAEE